MKPKTNHYLKLMLSEIQQGHNPIFPGSVFTLRYIDHKNDYDGWKEALIELQKEGIVQMKEHTFLNPQNNVIAVYKIS